MDHAVGNFIDGAVAARCQNEVATGLDLALRLNRRATRPGGTYQRRFHALSVQRFDDTLEQMLAARERSRNRIVDESGAFRAKRIQLTL